MQVKILVGISLFVLPVALAAQQPNGFRKQGYVFFAPGKGNIAPGRSTLQIGAGGEGFIYKGLAIGAELGPVGPLSSERMGSYTLGWFDDVVGVGSVNFSYHVLAPTPDRKLEPFFTAGYTMFFRAGISHGTNVGGGVNVWVNRNVALRFEVRNQAASYRWNLGARFGVTFR
jgi:hypothetical protein